MPSARLRVRLLLAGAAWPLLGHPATPLPPRSRRALPREVTRALARARIPRSAVSVVVQEAGSRRPRLEANAQAPVNPASLFKLLTTYAALDLLGPAWRWSTPVWLQGALRDPGPQGVLEGSLFIKGSGDPKLTLERVWLMLKRVQALGVHEIRGDIVLDQGAFEQSEVAPGDFDNEPLRPYNVRPEALLLAQKSVTYSFAPDLPRNLAVVIAEPALNGLAVDPTVPLVGGACSDWRGRLAASLGDPVQARFAGSYPASCGEQAWPVAYADPASYHARLLESMWRELGGRLGGRVREGSAPTDLPPSFELQSPPLAEVVRDINKFSNNVMAQQLFLSLGLQRGGQGTPQAAREVLRRWIAERMGELPPELVIDNGSGLSRDTRVSAAFLARLLQSAWAGPVMPELMASLPVIGLDGTLRRSQASAGRGHLKTGSLRDVAGIAGYVLGDSGRRYVLVAIINDPDANAGREALDALLQWTMADRS